MLLYKALVLVCCIDCMIHNLKQNEAEGARSESTNKGVN